jgi:hypothetical protein
MNRMKMISALSAMQQNPEKAKALRARLKNQKNDIIAQLYAAAMGKPQSAAAQASPQIQAAAKTVMMAQQQALRQAMADTQGKGAKASSKSTSRSSGKSSARSPKPSARTNRGLAKSSTSSKPTTIGRTKKGGRGRDPSKAKNMDELRKSLIKLGVSEGRLKNKNRAALEQMVRYQYQKGKSTSGGGTGTLSKLPKTYRGDYARILRLLRAGAISAQMSSGRSVEGVSDIPLSDVKARYDAFFKIYTPILKGKGFGFGAGARGKVPKGKVLVGRQLKSAPRKAKSKSRSVSVKTAYAAIKQQGKMPYYLAPGYTRVVGGGASGPGRVLAVPGSGAPPFSKLSEEEQRKVLRWFNTEAGKKMRGKGAKRVAEQQKILAAKKAVTKRPGTRKAKPKAA